MSLNELFTEHANKLRAKTGVSSKLSISDMTKLLDDLNWVKENLLKGTSDQWKTLTGQDWLNLTTATESFHFIDGFTQGTSFTYSATVSNTSSAPVRLVIYTYSDVDHRSKERVAMGGQINPSQTVSDSVSITISDKSKQIRTNIESVDGNTPKSSIKIKDERLYEGTEPGIWTSNPADKVGG